ncbi:MAG TPA: YiiX/YebB-like N1pC/P60 family cysteine hydrolase [Micavibrio sp.]|jgi:hypothetical protein
MSGNIVNETITRFLARHLQKTALSFKPATIATPFPLLQKALRPGDVLLVEGNQRISIAIKYLTQSTWSHAGVYIGDAFDGGSSDPDCLLEADPLKGITVVPLSKYAHLGTRICRPEHLSDEDKTSLIAYLMRHIGMQYDMKNAIDLIRYLLPQPPVPPRWRRRLLALGSGDPTRAICSTLIAQAFYSIRYPILPRITCPDAESASDAEKEIIHIRHHSLFTPRDFDISPYFRVIKPTLESGFDYKAITWDDALDLPC